MKNEQTKKMVWEALLVGSVFSLIFLLTFRLALAWTAQPSFQKQSLETPSLISECLWEDDCDGDNMPDICDDDSTDPENFEVTNGEFGCDKEINPDGNPDGDGYADYTCAWFNEHVDGMLDDKRTRRVEYWLPTACDNCPTDWNPEQFDFDSDGLGDFCDPYPVTPTSLLNKEGEYKEATDGEEGEESERDPVNPDGEELKEPI